MDPIRFVKVSYVHDWNIQNHNKREVSVAVNLGWDVIVFKPEGGNDGESEGYKFVYQTVKPLGNWAPKRLQQLAAGIVWAKALSKLTPDIISGHNMIGFFIGMLSNYFRSDGKKAKLVYDAHEYDKGIYQHSFWLVRCLQPIAEKFVINHARLSYFVNDSVAEAIQRDYELPEKPLVVRNVPFLAPEVTTEERTASRQELESLFATAGKDHCIVMYHGALMEGRGLETFIKVVEQMPEVYGVLLGYGVPPEYEQKLKSIIVNSSAKNRLAIHPAVPQRELFRYIAAADIEYVAITASNISFYLSLPNKLMESIQAGTPVVGSDFPEIGGLIHEWQIGVTCDPTNTDSICAAIRQLWENKALYDDCRSNMRRAREVLCWEEEGKKLSEAFFKLMGRG